MFSTISDFPYESRLKIHAYENIMPDIWYCKVKEDRFKKLTRAKKPYYISEPPSALEVNSTIALFEYSASGPGLTGRFFICEVLKLTELEAKFLGCYRLDIKIIDRCNS